MRYEKVEQMEGVRLIGHITDANMGMKLVARDGNELDLLAQGWNPLK